MMTCARSASKGTLQSEGDRPLGTYTWPAYKLFPDTLRLCDFQPPAINSCDRIWFLGFERRLEHISSDTVQVFSPFIGGTDENVIFFKTSNALQEPFDSCLSRSSSKLYWHQDTTFSIEVSFYRENLAVHYIYCSEINTFTYQQVAVTVTPPVIVPFRFSWVHPTDKPR